jgi:hypothetical protein
MNDHADNVPVLIAQTGELNGQRWTLDRVDLTIGRSPECEFTIPDRQVSREHARVTCEADGYYLEDLGSKNGTYLNGAQISGKVILQDGDLIQIALALKLAFLGTEATIPLSLSEAARMGLGRLRMDPDAHRVWVGDLEVDPALSLPQYRLLELLYENPARVVGREEVVETVWPDTSGEGVSEQAIDALVRRLRERLAEVDEIHSYITTVRGHGFRLNNPI